MSKILIPVVCAAVALELVHEGGRPHTEVTEAPQQLKAPQVSAITTGSSLPPGKFLTAGMSPGRPQEPGFDGSAWLQPPLTLRSTASTN